MSDIKDDEKEILLNHDYDNIQELDNPLPKWWLLTFYGAIIFSIFYYGYYELGSGPSLDRELKQDMVVIQERQEKAKEAAFSNVDWEALGQDETILVSGGKVFQTNCASCHGNLGQGIIGPNLTDAYWIRGKGDHEGISLVVRKGVLEKGMPPWETVLKPADVNAVTAYVYSLKGTNPKNPKAPQGEMVDE